LLDSDSKFPTVAPVTYSVQFQNGGFSLSDLIYISHSFVEFSKNCAGFLWILRCVALWPFLRVELVCATTRKPQNLDPANLYNIVEMWNINKDKLKVFNNLTNLLQLNIDEPNTDQFNLTAFLLNNCNIIDRAKHWSNLLFKEALAIHRQKPELNHGTKASRELSVFF
jgi:hypothetical protein